MSQEMSPLMTPKDLERILAGVAKRLTARVCEKSQKTGCMGVCEGCWKQKAYDTIVIHNKDLCAESEWPSFLDDDYEPLVEADDEDEAETPDEQQMKLRAIQYLQKQYAADGAIDLNAYDDDERRPFGRTALHEAVVAQDRELITQLMQAGDQDILATDNSGWTAWQLAVLEEDMEFLAFLENAGVRP